MEKTNTNSAPPFTSNEQLLTLLAWIFPLSLAGGSELLSFEGLGATWYAFRCVVVIGALLGVADLIMSRRSLPRWIWCWIIAAIFWLTWAVLNRGSEMDIALWQKGLFYLILGFASLITIFYLASNGKHRTMISASVVGLFVNFGVSALQMVSSLRPDSAFARELVAYSSEHYVRFVPTGLFDNPNYFAMYVCSHLLFVYSFRRYLSFATRMVLYAISALVLVITHSRIGDAAALILLVLIVLENRNWLILQWARLAGKIVIAMVFIVAVWFSHSWVNTREQALLIEQKNNELQNVKTSSEAGRMELIHCGYEMLASTNFKGIGVGQFQQEIQRRGYQERTGGMIDPHCGILEIAVESGVAVVLVWIAAMLVFIVQSFKKGFALQSSFWLIMLGLLQFANSTFVSTPVAWCLMAWPIWKYFETDKSS